MYKLSVVKKEYTFEIFIHKHYRLNFVVFDTVLYDPKPIYLKKPTFLLG